MRHLCGFVFFRGRASLCNLCWPEPPPCLSVLSPRITVLYHFTLSEVGLGRYLGLNPRLMHARQELLSLEPLKSHSYVCVIIVAVS